MINQFGAETRIFCDNWANAMITDALMSRIAASPAAILFVQDKRRIFVPQEWFQPHLSFCYTKWEGKIICFMFPKRFDATIVNVNNE